MIIFRHELRGLSALSLSPLMREPCCDRYNYRLTRVWLHKGINGEPKTFIRRPTGFFRKTDETISINTRLWKKWEKKLVLPNAIFILACDPYRMIDCALSFEKKKHDASKKWHKLPMDDTKNVCRRQKVNMRMI